MKKVFLYISIAITLLAIPITVFLVGQNQEVRKRAAPASTLSFSPASLTKKVGESFPIEIKLDTATNQVGLVQLRIVYDPAFLEAEDIVNGPLAPMIHVSKKIDPNGKVSISVGAKDTLHPITGVGSIAVLTMKAIKASATPISIKFTPSPDTAANAIGEGSSDVLIGRSPGSVIILNADGTPGTGGGETLSTPSPTPTPKVIAFGGSQGFTYAPNQITIKKGESVSWQGDFTSHPLVSVDDLWTTVNTGTDFAHTFTAAGTYTYFCQAHGTATTGMKGQIIVTEDGATLPTPTLTPTPTPLEGGEATTSAVTITSPTHNEDVATETPTFEGTGIPGSTITLTIYSEVQTVVVTVDENGNWVYTPTTPLEPGPHTVTALITDPNTGITETKTATFVVTASESSGSSTQSAIPVSGSAQTTILLITMGLILLVSGALMPILLK